MHTRATWLASLPLVNRVGYLSSFFAIGIGIFYLLILIKALMTGGTTFPPGEDVQLFGGVTTLLICPMIVLVMVSVHELTPASKHVLSLASLGFTLLFALAVSINRFNQLGVVRQAALAGQVTGIDWFRAYGTYSIMFGLEYLGWTWFLGLAMWCAAPIFEGNGSNRVLRYAMMVYGILGVVSSVGFLLGNWLAVLGFVAWGPVLIVVMGLLMRYFSKNVH